MKIFLGMVACIVLTGLLNESVNAEIKVIEADSSYIIGDNDSKIDARRIVVQEAKRKALDTAGTYIESLTEVKNMALSRDEVRAYSAGILEAEIVSEDMKGTAERPEIFIKVKCRIDTSTLTEQINNFKNNEDLKEQLDAALKENESLKREREKLVNNLSSEKDKSKAEDIRKKLDKVLLKEESNDDIRKVWGNLASKIDFRDLKDIRGISQKEMSDIEVILKKAIQNSPDDQRARMLLAMIYQKKGDKTNAEKELRAAIKLNTSNPLLHMKLGMLLRSEARYKEALDEFNLADRTKPNKPDVLFQTGMTYKEMKDCDNAVPYLKKFLVSVKNRENFPAKMKHEAMGAMKECKAAPPQKRIREKPLRRR